MFELQWHTIVIYTTTITVCGICSYTFSVGFHPFIFGWMNPRSWRDAPEWGASPWLGILVKSSLVSECVQRACVRWRLQFLQWILSSSPLTYTLEFSCGGLGDNLTHCVDLKKKLELLQRFEFLPSLWRCVMYVCLYYAFVLFVSVGWYSSCSDTWSLFTWKVCTINIIILEHIGQLVQL